MHQAHTPALHVRWNWKAILVTKVLLPDILAKLQPILKYYLSEETMNVSLNRAGSNTATTSTQGAQVAQGTAPAAGRWATFKASLASGVRAIANFFSHIVGIRQTPVAARAASTAPASIVVTQGDVRHAMARMQEGIRGDASLKNALASEDPDKRNAALETLFRTSSQTSSQAASALLKPLLAPVAEKAADAAIAVLMHGKDKGSDGPNLALDEIKRNGDGTTILVDGKEVPLLGEKELQERQTILSVAYGAALREVIGRNGIAPDFPEAASAVLKCQVDTILGMMKSPTEKEIAKVHHAVVCNAILTGIAPAVANRFAAVADSKPQIHASMKLLGQMLMKQATNAEVPPQSNSQRLTKEVVAANRERMGVFEGIVLARNNAVLAGSALKAVDDSVIAANWDKGLKALGVTRPEGRIRGECSAGYVAAVQAEFDRPGQGEGTVVTLPGNVKVSSQFLNDVDRGMIPAMPDGSPMVDVSGWQGLKQEERDHRIADGVKKLIDLCGGDEAKVLALTQVANQTVAGPFLSAAATAGDSWPIKSSGQLLVPTDENTEYSLSFHKDKSGEVSLHLDLRMVATAAPFMAMPSLEVQQQEASLVAAGKMKANAMTGGKAVTVDSSSYVAFSADLKIERKPAEELVEGAKISGPRVKIVGTPAFEFLMSGVKDFVS